jgi:hypothetical protein
LYAGVDQRVGHAWVSRRTCECDGTGNALRRFGCRVGVAPVEHHAGALCGEQLGDRQPDTARAADDDRAAAGQANRRRPLA